MSDVDARYLPQEELTPPDVDKLPQANLNISNMGFEHLTGTKEEDFLVGLSVAKLSSEVSKALIEGATLSDTLTRCTELVVQHLEVAFARIWTLNQKENVLELKASSGLYTHVNGGHSHIPVGAFKIGRIAQERQPHLTNNVRDDPSVSDQEWAKHEGMVAFAGYPLLIEEQLVGVIAVFARHHLTPITLVALETVARLVALSIKHKASEAQLQERTETVVTINRIGQLLSAELDLQKLLQAVTDAATELTGAQFGSFFYNVKDEKRGESYTVYTISGVPLQSFSHFPMPRNTHLFGPTFRGEDTILVADVHDDSRYGQNPPYWGMPAGHLPVTSYLAVPVISRSGEVLGGLFFGHAQAGVFTRQHAQIIEGLAAQTAIAVDNARLYGKAQQVIEAQYELDQLKNRFVSIASHELRTPLTSLKGYAQLLKRNLLKPQSTPSSSLPSLLAHAAEVDANQLQEQLLPLALEPAQIEMERNGRLIDTLLKQVKRMETLVGEMLDISRIVSNQLELQFQPISNLTALVEQVVAEQQTIANHHKLVFVKDSQTVSIIGSVDEARIEQVLNNLINNAVKYSPKGTTITVSIEEQVNNTIAPGLQPQDNPKINKANHGKPSVLIRVQDEGYGISEQEQSRIFEHFYRVRRTENSQIEGLGLGLYISHQIVTRHGGQIWVESQPGQGSIFYVLLPLEPASHS